jgi:putative ABC transport system ATP-binding protein
MPPIIEFEDIAKLYSGSTFKALDEVSVKIDSGEQVAIIGPSGGGKSTLLNIMATLDAPTSGSYRFDGQTVFDSNQKFFGGPLRYLGQEWRNAKIRRDMGFVFQTPFMLGNLNVFDNLRTAYSINKGVAPLKSETMEILEQLGLADKAFDSTEKLSGGQRQRVAIGRALLPHPKVLFADEPTGSLDVNTSRSIIELLKEMCSEKGATLVLVTHNPEVAVKMHRCIGVRDGKIGRVWNSNLSEAELVKFLCL